MNPIPVAVLVVAKAPVPGLAKTRLAAGIGSDAAADIAAAALLDTLDAVEAAPVAARVVALTGDLDSASRGAEIRSRLETFTVVDQRGADFAARLANAHADAAAATGGLPVLQIGMDTPQVTAELIVDCATVLLGVDAVVGMARDGGWWILGVRSADIAESVRDVPMSQDDTGILTLKALYDRGVEVKVVAELDDVDVVEDLDAVRRECSPDSRFARSTLATGI